MFSFFIFISIIQTSIPNLNSSVQEEEEKKKGRSPTGSNCKLPLHMRRREEKGKRKRSSSIAVTDGEGQRERGKKEEKERKIKKKKKKKKRRNQGRKERKGAACLLSSSSPTIILKNKYRSDVRVYSVLGTKICLHDMGSRTRIIRTGIHPYSWVVEPELFEPASIPILNQ
ncbi:hypothetical protein Pfo_001998 [Paulownia fortunei]|nr:hypothetical protein Pfo_001998 [Paulownia fortunei]